MDHDSLPLYRFATSATLAHQRGNLISIVGRVTKIDPDRSSFSISISETHNITILVTEHTLAYLPPSFDPSKLKRKQEKLLADKYLRKCQGLPPIQDDPNEDQPRYQQGPALLETVSNGTAFTRQITAQSFTPQQYVEVRGLCVDANTIDMHEFTDYQDKFDLEGYYAALEIGLARLPALFA